MKDDKIDPAQITKPIQLVAVWLIGLVTLVGIFVTASGVAARTEGLAVFYAITAAAIVPMFVILIFLMQTRFRPMLQSDEYYSVWLKDFDDRFNELKTSLAQTDNPAPPAKASGADPAFMTLEQKRHDFYRTNDGVFLVHRYKPSAKNAKQAEIILSLHQHRSGHLSEGRIKSVEYCLGRGFGEKNITVTDAKGGFALALNAFGPFLCYARVLLLDGSSFELSRYVDFQL